MIAEWIWLQEIVKGVRLNDKLRLLDRYADPELILRTPFSELRCLGITQNIHETFFTNQALDQARMIQDRHMKRGIQHITRHDTQFRGGDWLVLYYKGSLAARPAAAVVGTRQCSAHGYYYARQVCNNLISDGYVINSGMALGIDHQAHRSAIERGGKTQAFLAHGLDLCYPREHSGLMATIIENGAVISPFVEGVRAYRHHFAIRNALMCAWSDEVIVVEAPERSGALMTAEFARQQDKRIWTIDYPSMSERCAGNRKLLALGAKPCQSTNGTPLSDPVPDDELIRILRHGPLSSDELVDTIGKPFSLLEEHLLKYTLQHWVVFSGDGKWHYNGW